MWFFLSILWRPKKKSEKKPLDIFFPNKQKRQESAEAALAATSQGIWLPS
jgi:hypothetical protein